MMLDERWKAIKGYAGLYEISDRGRVKSSYREGIFLAGSPTIGGYERVTLWANKTRKCCKIHTLVLEAFIGPRPFAYVCDHIDGNTSNNYVENLEWVTPTENKSRGKLPEIRKGMIGENCPNVYLNEKDVLAIRKKYKAGSMQILLAVEYGVSRTHISRIVTRKNWTHI